LIPSILESDGSSKARPPRPETGTGSGGATRLPAAAQSMHYPKRDFLVRTVLVIGLGQGFSGSTFRGLPAFGGIIFTALRVTQLRHMPRLKPGL